MPQKRAKPTKTKKYRGNAKSLATGSANFDGHPIFEHTEETKNVPQILAGKWTNNGESVQWSSQHLKRVPDTLPEVLLVRGDTHKVLPDIPDNSVHLVYVDPPFGITSAEWDIPLNWDAIWPELWRVLVPDGVVAMHSSMPFTIDLINTQRKPYRYMWHLRKTNAKTLFPHAKWQPLRQMEEIPVFFQKKGRYFPQMVKGKVHNRGNPGNNAIYGNKFKKLGSWKTDEYYPTHYIETQMLKGKSFSRPVELAEYFVKTYTKPGERVLDITMSNGTSGVAARNLGRSFIGIDLSPTHYVQAKRRLEGGKK